MQAQAMRVYQITFLGRNAEGKLPMFTRICAMTGKGAVRAFTERYQPVSGWFLGDPEDITDKVNREAEDTDGQHADMKKAG
ncbi:hypothetical protein CE665_25775 [Salmonella enterica subsp. enterica serovar Poona]|nr:hypothetical protein [Salmonella enterica subsp. diarizonae]EDJ2557707.1 hypothetical protein [Salmonella enterica subsp. enterica serovar Poona]EJM2521731.1 hypothetical protein [Salmonella enterica]